LYYYFDKLHIRTHMHTHNLEVVFFLNVYTHTNLEFVFLVLQYAILPATE